MGNAIQSGIYRIALIFLLALSANILLAQDYYIDKQGTQQEINVSRWYFNECFLKSGEETAPLSVIEVSSVYRNIAQINYIPYSKMVSDQDYADFLMPSVESLRALSTDYFVDEHFEVWLSNDYIVYHITNADYVKSGNFFDLGAKFIPEAGVESLVLKNNPENLPNINSDVIFLYHDSVGFNKIVADDIEDDYFRLQISKYTFNASLNDSIFSDEFKLKPKNFLKFFDEELSPLTAIQHNDKDLAGYYISSLHQDGALILLLNLDKRKIDLYRDSGQTKLADDLENKLLVKNKSLAMAFLAKEVYNFSSVYVTDAKNRPLILSGETKNIFLDGFLNIDSSLVLKEPFYLFARKGQVFETQVIDQNNMRKKQVTSNPVVQDAMVIYDQNNVQLMDPFPFYTRTNTAALSGKKKPKATKVENVVQTIQQFVDISKETKELKTKYAFEDLDGKEVAVASTFNQNFYSFYRNTMNRKNFNFKIYNWENKNVWNNNKWKEAPEMPHYNLLPNLPIENPSSN